MATHYRVPAWRIPGKREPGGLPSLGSHRVRCDWSDLAAAAECPLLSNSVSELKLPREWVAACIIRTRSTGLSVVAAVSRNITSSSWGVREPVVLTPAAALNWCPLRGHDHWCGMDSCWHQPVSQARTNFFLGEGLAVGIILLLLIGELL